MKQIIEEVFEAEKKANEIIKQAREKASQIRQSAEKENLEKIAEAKQKAKELIQNTVENAGRDAELMRQEKLKQADSEKESILKNEEIIKGLVDNICNIVITTEIDSFQTAKDA
jgi:vacuolar-type H+-ATPase subunit H